MKKRILSALLSLCMVLTLLPGALATDGAQDAGSTPDTEVAAPNGGQEGESLPAEAPALEIQEQEDGAEPTEPTSQEQGDVAETTAPPSEGQDKAGESAASEEETTEPIAPINEEDDSVAPTAEVGALQMQINSASDGATIALTDNVTESITIPKGKEITLDLKGNKLTNEAGKHTITVDLGGSLTVIDPTNKGSVDNVSHGRAALYNNGTAELSGGTFTRSQENGKSAEDSGGNSYYNILNHGEMLIGPGTKVEQSGGFSSMIVNGYYDYTGANSKGELSQYIAGINQPNPELTINSGKFDGGLNTVKNDDGGIVTINGGVFTNVKQTVVFNVNEATINGGTFSTKSGAKEVLYNRKYDDNQDKGVLKVTGGVFTATGATALINVYETNAGNVTVTGGLFSDDVSAYVPDTHESVKVGDQYAIATQDQGAAVAQAGDHYYESLSMALTVAQDKETVTLLKDAEGAGASFPGIRTLTIDLGGHTFTVTDPTVGSTGTETNGFQLLKGNKVTFKNGTVKVGGSAYILFQNYCDLTLENVTVDCRDSKQCQYAISNNFGSLTLKGNTNIYAAEGQMAFDLWYGMSSTYYDGVTVTADESMTGTVQGKIEYGAQSNQTDWITKTALVIRNGCFDTTFVASSNHATLAQANIKISGGYFTADPSAYLTDKKVAVASDKTGYAFMVAEAKVDNVAVAPAAPEIKPADTTGKSDEEKQAIGEAVEALKPAPGTSTVEVSQEAIKAAAGNVAASVTTEDAAKATESLKSEGVTVNPGDTVTIYVQPYLDIAVTDAKVGGSDITELSLDITPKAKLVASTATDAEGIVTDDAGKNAVVVDTQELALNTPVEITVPLPAAFSTGSELYVKHVKDNGKVYYYTATVAGDAKKTATFINPNGFSKFTLMATNEAAAEVGGVGYASFQEAVDAVANGGTIVAQKDITATVSGHKTFTVDANGHTVSLSAASGYTLAKSGDTYTVSKATDSGNEPTHSSSSGSSGSSNRTLTFVTNGGTAVKSVSKASGTVIDLSGYKTTRAGYTFEGWYSDSGLTEKVDTVKLTSNTKVYAKWSQDGAPADSVAGFTDVTSGDWYAAAVEYVTGKGMMNGTSTAKFAPEDKLTRGMIAQVLYNLEGKPAASGAAFTDVASTAWYADAVNWAASKSIVSGYGNNTFGPEDPITREQMAAILYRYAQYKAYDVTAKGELAGFTDRSAVSGYAAEALEWAVGAKLMNGKGNGVLDPAGNATRAEVAQILMNFSENVAK